MGLIAPDPDLNKEKELNTSLTSIIQSPKMNNSLTSILQSPRTPLSRLRPFGVGSQSQGIDGENTQERLTEDINLLSSPIMFTDTPTSRIGFGPGTPSRHRSDIRSDYRITRHVFD